MVPSLTAPVNRDARFAARSQKESKDIEDIAGIETVRAEIPGAGTGSTRYL